MRSKKAGAFSTLFFGVLFLAAGGALIYFWGWPTIVEAKASRSWPSTPGTITVSKVESHPGKKGRRMYSHHIEYTFVVDGVPHKGNRVWVGDGGSSSNSSSAQRTVSRYSVGSETLVYYDPDAPDACALQSGTTWMTYGPFVFGGLFFLIGALLTGAAAFKLFVGAFMIGAAATTAIGKSVVPANRNYETTNRPPPSSTDDDDGIEIT